MNLLQKLFAWFRLGTGGTSLNIGAQTGSVAQPLINTQPADFAAFSKVLQISTAWRCIDLIASNISTLPVFVYRNRLGGMRDLARGEPLYNLMHDTPNPLMTAAEFWQSMLLSYLTRGNAYARLDRNGAGEVIAMYPISPDQITPYIDPDELTLSYLLHSMPTKPLLKAENVLHIKDAGSGLMGMSRVSYMGASIYEAENSQKAAASLFANGDKPAGILTTDKILTTEQRNRMRKNFRDIAEGADGRLHILEANLKYEKTSMTPDDAQLLATRQFGVEEICRWFGVPPVLVGHSNTTAWGSGIEQIIDGFYKLTIRTIIKKVEQVLHARVLTAAQQTRYTIEFELDALLRANAKDRFDIYSKAVQNGIYTRNECRQLENLPSVAGGDELTAQVNLVPLDLLGKQGVMKDVAQEPVAQ